MKIFWSSNAPFVASGYGQTTARFTPRIRDMGHDVAIFAYYGLKGTPMEWEGMIVYPGMSDGFGNDVIGAYALHHMNGDRNAGWVILLQDVWTMKSEKLKELHTAAWAPVDHSPCPPAVVEFFERTSAIPIAQSDHGRRMFEQAGLRPLYVPHAIDTNLFRPMDTRAEARDRMGIPQDAFVFGMVAANTGTAPSRKAFPEVFVAFADFCKKHTDAVLYCHTMKTKMHTGIELGRLAEACGIPEDNIVFVDQFDFTIGAVNTEAMPQIYSAIDVLVNPAYGEGFGMPIIESQSCGVPVILADNTAMPELLGGGWLCPSYKAWDEEQRSWWGRVHTPELLATLEKAYQHSSHVRREAREFIVRNYDLDHVMANYWKPTLDVMEQMLQTPVAEPVDMSSLDV